VDLLRGRPRPLGPDEGEEAFRHHKLLAAEVHRASRLDRRANESETESWIRYVMGHFPGGRNGEAEARVLWSDWRTSLLKQNTPGGGVVVTHGQPTIHWVCDQHRRLCVNLDDAWDDFESSVDSFVAHLQTSPRRNIVLRRWRKAAWTVEAFIPADPLVPVATCMTASVGTSITMSLAARSVTGNGP